jgi:2-hydroxy-6-oxonona-2,4-dienedioate hydrolase/4,5:9,10-diseco-3-hydroxy-5,9,17-trioxoandrosta-1(10),2-diene-4-oate hydrolase
MSSKSEGGEMDTTAFELAQRKLLERFGVDARSRFLEIDGPVRRAHALDAGSGEPIVLLHGGGSFAGHWASLMPELEGYRLIAIDRPGHGLSDRFVYSRDVDVRAHAVDFLDRVLDALGLDEEVAFVANSMGGLWAFWLALDRPHRVSRLVQLGCPAVLLETSAPLGLRLTTAPFLGRALLALEPPSQAQVLKLLGRLGDRHPLERPAEFVEAYLEAERLFAESWFSLVKRFTGPVRRRDISLGAAELGRVRQPVHFVWGEHDVFGPPSVGDEAVAILPEASIDVLPTGHLPWLELPARVGAIVREFLGRRSIDREVRVAAPAWAGR